MREWLARKLYPEAFQDQERYRYLLNRVQEVGHWCRSDFPQAGMISDWLYKSMRVHFMPAADYHQAAAERRFSDISIERIDGFREQLRQAFPKQEPRP